MSIGHVNHREGLTFEQILIANNPKSRGFRAIGRRTKDHHVHRRLDLLGCGKKPPPRIPR